MRSLRFRASRAHSAHHRLTPINWLPSASKQNLDDRSALRIHFQLRLKPKAPFHSHTRLHNNEHSNIKRVPLQFSLHGKIKYAHYTCHSIRRTQLCASISRWQLQIQIYLHAPRTLIKHPMSSTYPLVRSPFLMLFWSSPLHSPYFICFKLPRRLYPQ